MLPPTGSLLFGFAALVGAAVTALLGGSEENWAAVAMCVVAIICLCAWELRRVKPPEAGSAGPFFPVLWQILRRRRAEFAGLGGAQVISWTAIGVVSGGHSAPSAALGGVVRGGLTVVLGYFLARVIDAMSRSDRQVAEAAAPQAVVAHAPDTNPTPLPARLVCLLVRQVGFESFQWLEILPWFMQIHKWVLHQVSKEPVAVAPDKFEDTIQLARPAAGEAEVVVRCKRCQAALTIGLLSEAEIHRRAAIARAVNFSGCLNMLLLIGGLVSLLGWLVLTAYAFTVIKSRPLGYIVIVLAVGYVIGFTWFFLRRTVRKGRAVEEAGLSGWNWDAALTQASLDPNDLSLGVAIRRTEAGTERVVDTGARSLPCEAAVVYAVYRSGKPHCVHYLEKPRPD